MEFYKVNYVADAQENATVGKDGTIEAKRDKNNIRFRVKDGETFTVGGMEFIKFPEVDGQVPVVMKGIAFRSRFGNNNDLRSSEVLRRMENEVLPKIIEAIGKENLCTFQTDLTTLDGIKTYGVMESLISLPTLDFYQQNVEIFDKHNPGIYWWLATPESEKYHDNPWYILCVSPSGNVDFYFYCDGLGVRPILIFHSSIFESSEA